MPRNAATNRFRIRDFVTSLKFGAATTDRVVAASGITTTNTGATISLYYRATSLYSGTAQYFAMSSGGSWILRIDALTGGQLRFYFDGSGSFFNTGIYVNDYAWHKLDLTFSSNGVTATGRFYIDGALRATLTPSGASVAITNEIIRFGNHTSSNAPFLGLLDECRVWNRPLTANEISDAYYNNIIPTSGLLMEYLFNEGAGSVAADTSGNANNGTITGATFSADVPMKARKASVNANMVKNGDFEYAPPFTAATTSNNRWIDGTAAGSTTNDLFGWTLQKTGSGSGNFDSSVFKNGSYSLKVSTTSTASIALAILPATTNLTDIDKYSFRLQPNTSYRMSGWMKTNLVSGSATTGAQIILSERSATGSNTVDTPLATGVLATTDWTFYSLVITTSSTTVYGFPKLQVKGDNGAATLIMDAWFDDISLTPVYPEGRVPANGNLVKNFDFEVAPTFVAASNTVAAWMVGTAAGSSTNATYKWALQNQTGTSSARFDPTVVYSGLNSMKLSLTATNSQVGVSIIKDTVAATVNAFGIPVIPNTSYTGRFRMRTNYVSGDSNDGANVQFVTRNVAGTALTINPTTLIKTTTDWTEYTLTFTTDATAAFVTPRMYVQGTSGTATLIMDAWFDDIYLAKTEIAPVAQASATGTFTISDYQFLGGKDAIATITITDYTLMTGGNLDVLGGGIVITEGVDFDAETSNDVTASNLATAFNTAAGETIATVVGAVITFAIPGSNDGAPMEWSGSGVTPASTAFSGGFDRTNVYVNALFRTFGDDTSQGSSNDEAATNLATNFQGQGINAVAVGNVVTITAASPGSAGNTTTISVVGRDAGPLSGGITPSGATLTGGADAVAGQYPGRIPIT